MVRTFSLQQEVSRFDSPLKFGMTHVTSSFTENIFPEALSFREDFAAKSTLGEGYTQSRREGRLREFTLEK